MLCGVGGQARDAEELGGLEERLESVRGDGDTSRVDKLCEDIMDDRGIKMIAKPSPSMETRSG